MLLTPFAKRAKGPNEVTNGKARISHSEASYHVYQPFFTGISHEMRVGMGDRAISGLHFDAFVAQSYCGKMAVNRVDLKREFWLLLNLYLVSDSANRPKPSCFR